MTKKARIVIEIVLISLWVIIALFLSQFLLSFVFRLIYQATGASQALLQTLYSACSYGLALFLIIFIPRKIKKNWGTTKKELGLLGLPTWTDVFLAPIGFIVYVVLAALITNIFALLPWFNPSEAQNVGFNNLIVGSDRFFAFLSLVVITPIVEELIFRGFLYIKLKAKIVEFFSKRKLGTESTNSQLVAIKSKSIEKISSSKPKKIRSRYKRTEIITIVVASLITSLVFAVMHGQWNVGVNVFVMSMVLCFMREVTNTIYSGILLHMIKNAIAFYIVYIVNSGF